MPIFEDQRISIVINNAGKMDRAKFLDQNPQDIEDMIKTNIHHDVIFSKYATLNFLKHAGEHNHKTALIHTSSIASDLAMPFSSVYSGTKRFNEVFGLLLAQ
jgi:short-subunit dehydrogenase